MTANRKSLLACAYTAVLLFSLFLLFKNLDRKLLWGDEAETALLAKNVLQFGIPKTTNGINHITVLGDFRDENRANIWTWAPWLQEYVTAGAFFAFGDSTWSSRALFAGIAWATVGLLGCVAFQIYRSHSVTLSTLILFATSEVFLLHARQCRYYAITLLAEVLLVYGANELLKERRRAAWIIGTALVLQFYTNFILVAANMPLLLCLGWLCRRRTKVLKAMALAIGIVIIAALPWLIYAEPWRQAAQISHEQPIEKAFYYIGEWHFHFVPLIFFAVPLLSLLRSKPLDDSERIRKLETALVGLMIGYLIVLLVPQSELRYLLPLLPIGCLLAGAWLVRYIGNNIAIGAIIGIQATTNLIAIVTTPGLNQDHRLRAPLADFILSLNQPYADRFSDVLQFFRANAAPGQQVWVRDPEFPLIFYTGLRVIDGRLTAPQELPDWILPESCSGLVEQEPLQIPDSIKANYDPILLTVHDSDRFDNVPEPDVYQYRTTNKLTQFVVYKYRR